MRISDLLHVRGTKNSHTRSLESWANTCLHVTPGGIIIVWDTNIVIEI